MEKWQQDLQDLMRERRKPHSKDIIQRIMRSRSDDRSAALTCAVFAELGLVAAIATAEQPHHTQIIKLFWKPSGKYGTFDKKITHAFKMGLIGSETKHNLEIVRRVRNVFAHSIADVRFTTPAIQTACSLINGPSSAVGKAGLRKSRFAYCQVCDLVFQTLLNHAGFNVILLGAMRHKKLLLP